MNLILPCSSLLMIYKLFVKPHLDYGVTEYDQANNSLLGDKVNHCNNSTLAITVLWRDIRRKIVSTIGFESLKDRRWKAKLCYLYKIIYSKRPSYLYDLLAPLQTSH